MSECVLPRRRQVCFEFSTDSTLCLIFYSRKIQKTLIFRISTSWRPSNGFVQLSVCKSAQRDIYPKNWRYWPKAYSRVVGGTTDERFGIRRNFDRRGSVAWRFIRSLHTKRAARYLWEVCNDYCQLLSYTKRLVVGIATTCWTLALLIIASALKKDSSFSEKRPWKLGKSRNMIIDAGRRVFCCNVRWPFIYFVLGTWRRSRLQRKLRRTTNIASDSSWVTAAKASTTWSSEILFITLARTRVIRLFWKQTASLRTTLQML